jgi:hypothetical protein
MSAPSLNAGAEERRVDESLSDLLRRGYQVFAKLDPTDAPPLQRWLGKENELVAAVCKHGKGGPSVISDKEYDAAVQAVRVGRVLAIAEQAPPLRIPHAFGDQQKDIERLATRLHGFGLGKAITTDNLRQVSPAQMRSLIDTSRKLGLLADGQGWATKTVAAKCISHDLGHLLGKNQTLDRGVSR